VFMPPSAKSNRASRSDPSAQPLERALECLRGHGLPYQWHSDLRRWDAVCPACRTPAWTLVLFERYRGASIDARCTAGCTEEAILTALLAKPIPVQVAESLALAEALSAVAHEALDLVRREVAP
jgi:hypothetical protein